MKKTTKKKVTKKPKKTKKKVPKKFIEETYRIFGMSAFCQIKAKTPKKLAEARADFLKRNPRAVKIK